MDALPRERTVFFFPVGPIEDHGPHLPIGLDLSQAEQLCRLAAERLEREMPGWQGVIFPTAPLGLDSNTTRLAITVRAHVLRDWLVDASRSLMRQGFFHFVCLSGHLGPRQLTAIEDAGKIIAWSGWKQKLRKFLRKGPVATLVSASSILPSPSEVRRSPFWADPLEHGGEVDTSIALALSPSTVASQLSSLPSIERPSSFSARAWERFTRSKQGYWGKPAQASAAKGEQALRKNLDEVFPKLRAVWEGANPNWLFRSWYSVLPPNKSFATAWLLAFMMLGLFLAWIAIFMDGIRV